MSGKQSRGSVGQGANNGCECVIWNINISSVSELPKLCQYLSPCGQLFLCMDRYFVSLNSYIGVSHKAAPFHGHYKPIHFFFQNGDVKIKPRA